MRIGYARVSTLDQNPDLQLERLKAADASALSLRGYPSRTDRPELTRLPHDILREGDNLLSLEMEACLSPGPFPLRFAVGRGHMFGHEMHLFEGWRSSRSPVTNG